MEATTTLADALLDDLDDLSDIDDAPKEEEDDGDQKPSATTDDDDEHGDSKAPSASTGLAISWFLENPVLLRLLITIREHDVKNVASRKSQKEREAEDHQLVVQCNKHLASLADELARAHGDLATAYKPKFPELEELLPNSVQYKNAVRTIWNETDLTKVNDQLNDMLNSNQIITISVAGSTTSGRALDDQELENVDAAASYMERLLEVQQELVQFVENSMESLAPSVCAVIGAPTAARLLGLAGGLAELTKIPACNLQVLGQVKHNSSSRAGLASSSVKQHVGILADCELIRNCPKPLQKKALKAVASKLALCARFDFVNVDTGRPRSASAGRQFRQELQTKFQKLQEPDKAPVLKALPK
jgi:U4/U6 small nuclear ribonucleoprotein PRP31